MLELRPYQREALDNSKRGKVRNDLSGKVFGYWFVKSYAGPSKKKRGGATWLCRCVCGTEKIVSAENLTRRKSKSCGCKSGEMRGEKCIKHGQSRAANGRPSGAYKSWHAMRQRVENANHKQYADYGGRGISICDEWHDFQKFYEDMGDRPEGMTLDRIDPNGNYGPDNCKWSTVEEQAINKRPRIRHGDVIEIVGAAREVVVAANDNMPIAIQRLQRALNNLDSRAS